MTTNSEYAEYYRSLSDVELQKIAMDWSSLVEDARRALETEFVRRGMVIEDTPEDADAMEISYRELVTIRQYRDLSEAIVARAVVESAGIFCFLKDENYVRLDWQMSNLIGGIRLQVAPADVPATEDILAQPIPKEIIVSDQSSYEQPSCPKCHSIDIVWERHGRKAALLSLHLLSVPLPRGSESWLCNSCGLRWIDDEE